MSTPNDTADAWEAAYLRFESPDEEVAKFKRRFVSLGARGWPQHLAIVELFCGRGNGLRALARLGFREVEGVDLSERLLALCPPEHPRHHADCRALPFGWASKDIVIVQGGLHHLASLPDDLEKVIAEVVRVLRPGGRLVVVEPWQTPFLSLVHFGCGQGWLRQMSRKVDALADMIEGERATYEQWLSQPELVQQCLTNAFVTEQNRVAWGKLMWVGRKR